MFISSIDGPQKKINKTIINSKNNKMINGLRSLNIKTKKKLKELN